MALSKKGGTIVKVVAAVAGLAAVGTACYVYKDKIKEFFEKPEVKEKIDSAKSFVSNKVLGNKEEDFFDDAEFFDDETEASADSSDRGYTSINIASEDDVPEAPKPTVTEPEPEQDTAAEEEDIPFEYEGLSDVSEDEDVLADEAALDGDAE